MDLTAGFWLGPQSLHLVLAGSQGDHATFWVPSHPRVSTMAAVHLLLDAAFELAGGSSIASFAVALPASTGHGARVTVLQALSAAHEADSFIIATPLAAALSAFKCGDVLTLEIERGAVAMGWIQNNSSGFDLAGLMSWRDPEWRPEVQEGHPVYASYLSEAPLITPALMKEMAATFTDGQDDRLPPKILALGPLAWNGPLLSAFQSNIDIPVVGVGPDELARGAARYARIRSGFESGIECSSILDSVVGIDSTDPESFVEVLDWFDPLPSMRSFSVTTAADDQRDLAVSIYQGPSNDIAQASLAGVFGIDDLPQGPAGSVSIELMLDVDDNGLIGISAFDSATQRDLAISIISGPQESRYCVDCGFSSATEARFCEGCGHDLDENPPTEVIDRQLTAVMALSQRHSEGATISRESVVQEVTCLPCGSTAHAERGHCHSCGFPTHSLIAPLSLLDFTGLPVSRATIIDALRMKEGGREASQLTVVDVPRPMETGDKECPFCAETIKVAARKCRHCGEFLEEAQIQQAEPIIQDKRDRHPSSGGAFLFISHASQDQDVALDVASALDGAGLDTWLATRDVQVGSNYASEIYEAIAECTHLLVLLSPTSVQSQHVKREANLAIDLGKPLLPLVVAQDADFMRALPSEWKYWLGVVQAAPYTDAQAAVMTVKQSIRG